MQTLCLTGDEDIIKVLEYSALNNDDHFLELHTQAEALYTRVEVHQLISKLKTLIASLEGTASDDHPLVHTYMSKLFSNMNKLLC